MNKSSSVLAALEAGKLPSTQQLDRFFQWLSDVGITNIEPSSQGELSSQGRVLSSDLRGVLDSYKQFLDNKNHDNIVQQALWNLQQGDLAVTDEAKKERDQALNEIRSLQRSLLTILKVGYQNIATEGVHLFSDFASVSRLMLADAAELIESTAGMTKESLRGVEDEVQQGSRDSLGRDKKRVESEKDVKVAWEHGMDTVRDAGSSVIGAGQIVTRAVEDKSERTSSRLQNAYYSICDRAQSDPAYRHAMDTIFTILQKRLDKCTDAVADPNFSFSSFIADPTDEQHVPQALDNLKTFLERVSNVSFDPLAAKFRATVRMIVNDPDLKAYFDESLTEMRRDLTDTGYVRSEEAKERRKELRSRWQSLREKDTKWSNNIDELKKELGKVERGFNGDKDLNQIKAAHKKLNEDIEQGLIEVTKEVGKEAQEAQGGLQAALEQVTWFWQDLFKVYLPRFLAKMKDIPIPRTEYKDDEIEFVLENLDISSFRILPSHVYIRNITDVDIRTSANPSEPSQTSVGALTHIRVQAVQLSLNDVSFWYKDKTAGTLTPSEFTGLLHFDLPEKGLDLDLKLRLIPVTVKGAHSRENLKHLNVIEKAEVTLAEDIGLEVKDSNHSIIATVFKPVLVMRLREALEKTLSEQVRAIVEWADGIVFDIGKRKEVFEDTGLGGGGSLMAAIWSEVGRLQREGRERGEMGVRATGTGIVVEQQLYSKDGQEGGKSAFAMGAEPQILSGEKRGPLGTASKPLKKRAEEVGRDIAESMDIDVTEAFENTQNLGGQVADKAQGIAGQAMQKAGNVLQEGKKQVSSFKRSVEDKAQLEKQRPGWESTAFDV